MFNFYLLPEELQEYINYLVLQKHQRETKYLFKNVLKEMECLWYWVIYGSSLIYKNIQPIRVLNHVINSDATINTIKISNYLPYIKPSKIKFIKNDINYIIN